MLKSVKNTILDIIRQADLLLLALCTVTSLFGVVMIYSATRYQGGLKCVIIQLCGAGHCAVFRGVHGGPDGDQQKVAVAAGL